MPISDKWFEDVEVDASAVCCKKARDTDALAFSYDTGWILWDGDWEGAITIRFCPFCGTALPSTANLKRAFMAYLERI